MIIIFYWLFYRVVEEVNWFTCEHRLKLNFNWCVMPNRKCAINNRLKVFELCVEIWIKNWIRLKNHRKVRYTYIHIDHTLCIHIYWKTIKYCINKHFKSNKKIISNKIKTIKHDTRTEVKMQRAFNKIELNWCRRRNSKRKKRKNKITRTFKILLNK